MRTLPPLGNDALADEDGRRIELDRRTKLPLRDNAYSVSRRFLESDDAARNVPSWPIEPIAPPRKQRASAIILDQEIDVDERRETADKEK